MYSIGSLYHLYSSHFITDLFNFLPPKIQKKNPNFNLFLICELAFSTSAILRISGIYDLYILARWKVFGLIY